MTTHPVTESENGTFLILDKKDGVAIHQMLYGLMDDPRWVPLFAETQWESYMEETPLLIEASPGTPFYRWALEAMADDNGLPGLLLESPHALPAVADWARQRLTVHFDGGRTGLLRYYDPVVWHSLVAEGGAENNPIARIHYWHGHWRTSERPAIARPGDPAGQNRQQTLEPNLI